MTLLRRQVFILAFYGAVLWFLAAVLVRTIMPMGAMNGPAVFATYALVVPGTVPAIWLARRIARLTPGQLPGAILIVTATALLLDGLAFALSPSLYGTDPTLVIKGAAVIFWGAGVGLALSHAMDRDA